MFRLFLKDPCLQLVLYCPLSNALSFTITAQGKSFEVNF